MKYQQGFGFLPIIVIIAVIAMVGAGGYVWWQKNGHLKTDYVFYTPTPTAKASASATPVVAADPYVGWKTYTSEDEGLSFRYPGNWVLATINPPNPRGDGVRVTSPSGNIDVTYVSQTSGLGGACGDPCPKAVVYHSEKFQIPGGNEVSFVEMADYHRFGLVDAQHYPDTALYYLLFASKQAGDDSVWFYGHPVGEHTYQTLPADQYFAMPEVKTAEKIIKSARYE